MLTRRESREAVFCLIYEALLNREENYRDIYERAVSVREIEENQYMVSTFFGAMTNLADIDTLIQNAAVGWRIDRLSGVTLAILRLGVYELVYNNKEVPLNVAINEAVELAKTYDTDSAPAFVNGILNKVAKEKYPADNVDETAHVNENDTRTSDEGDASAVASDE